MVAFVTIQKGKTPAEASDVQQVIDALSGARNTPIAVTVRKNNEQLPLVLYRTYRGIDAMNLKSGELSWWFNSGWSLDTMFDFNHQTGKLGPAQSATQHYLSTNDNVFFDNSVLGSLSADIDVLVGMGRHRGPIFRGQEVGALGPDDAQPSNPDLARQLVSPNPGAPAGAANETRDAAVCR